MGCLCQKPIAEPMSLNTDHNPPVDNAEKPLNNQSKTNKNIKPGSMVNNSKIKNYNFRSWRRNCSRIQ